MEQLSVGNAVLLALGLTVLALVVGLVRAVLVLPGASAWLSGYQDPGAREGVEFGPDPSPVISTPASSRHPTPEGRDVSPTTQRSQRPIAGQSSDHSVLGSIKP